MDRLPDMEYITEPKVTVRTPKADKEKPPTKYKVKAWVTELMLSPNKWAIYKRTEKTRQGMVNAYSAMDGYKRRYPHIEWAISKEDDCYAICGRFTPTETEQN